MRKLLWFILIIVSVCALFYGGWRFNEIRVLKNIIARLENDSRRAEVLVTNVSYDKERQRPVTTIKFLEYGVSGNKLEPEYFTFFGDIIQFQALVIRFQDNYVEKGDMLRGKSICLFWKVFALDGSNTQEYPLAKLHEVPRGYKLSAGKNIFEELLWRRFWEYALNPDKAEEMGIKSAQIEAPGTKFVPGILYTIKIEHSGGMRIDAASLPEILKGEMLGR